MTSMTDNRTTELLLCPFCGGEAEIIETEYSWNLNIEHEPTCFFATEIETEWTKAKAIAAWNQRHVETCEPPYDELLRCLENDWHISASWDGLRKFWCIELTEEGVKLRDAVHGTLTAEQVREAIEQHSAWVIGNNRCFHDGAYKVIADELNAERHVETCEPDEPDGWHKCPECGCVVGYWLLNDDSWTIYMDDYQVPFNACPNCGRRVTA